MSFDVDARKVTTRAWSKQRPSALDEAARTGIAKCTFKPALARGKPVAPASRCNTSGAEVSRAAQRSNIAAACRRPLAGMIMDSSTHL